MVDQIENGAGREPAGVLVDVLPDGSMFRVPGSGSLLYPACKRLIDIIGASAALLFFLPVLLLVGWLIRQDGGPALFRHPRVGRGGKIFMCLKIRTMVIDAQQRLEAVLDKDPAARAEWERSQKLANDPRVTKLGHLLRITSFDELPQFINVLRGEMSLVGPRPVTETELERYGGNVGDYLSCRPGITGLWQVSGRSSTDYRRRVSLDSEYARTASLRLDVSIMLKTVRVILSRDGAC
jgi:exopolysaccharide production protein ExoY